MICAHMFVIQQTRVEMEQTMLSGRDFNYKAQINQLHTINSAQNNRHANVAINKLSPSGHKHLLFVSVFLLCILYILIRGGTLTC